MRNRTIGIMAVCLLIPATLLSAASYGVKKQIIVGATGPQLLNLGFSPASNRMYCAANAYNMVLAVNCANDSSLGQLPGSFMTGPMVYNAAANLLYMKGNDELCAIDCAANTEDTTVGGFQGGLAVEYNPDNGKIYLFDDFSGQTHVYNSAGYTYNAAINGFAGPMLYYQPTNSVYIPWYSGDSLGVFSGATNAKVAALEISGLASGNKRMGANPAISRLYAALSLVDRVAIINTASNMLLASPIVGDNPAGFALCPLNNKMFVACNGASSRSLYAIDELGNADSVAVGDSIAAIVYNPSDSLIYCADCNNGYVRIVDPRGASPLLAASVYLGAAYARPVDLKVDNGGDVYVAASGLDWVPVIGKVPGRIWRSATASGQWLAPSSWEYSDNGGLTWGNPDSLCPSGVGDSIVTIQAGHAIILDIGGPAITIDQLRVEGTLAQLGSDLTIADGLGDDLFVSGVYQFSGGSFTQSPGATLVFDAYSQYTHAVNGGAIPTADWSPFSTLYIADVQNLAPAGMNQSFGEIRWYCPDQSGDIVLPGGPAFALRGLEVMSTGGSRLFLTSPAVPDLTINGDLLLQGSGNEVVLGGGGMRSVTVNGSFTVYDPAWLHLTDTSSPGISTLFLRGDYYHLVAGIAGGGPDSTTIVFCGAAMQRYSASGEMLTGHVNYRVDPGAFLVIEQWSNVGQNSLGWFQLLPGAALGMTDVEGLHPPGQDLGPVRVGGARQYSQDADYFFYSLSTGPYPTGPGFPDTVRQLVVESSGDNVILTRNLAVRDTLKLNAGALRVGARRLALLGQIGYFGGDLLADSTSRLAVAGNDPAPILIPATVSGLDTLVLDRTAGVNLGAPLPIRGACVRRSGAVNSNWLQYRPAASLVYELAGAGITGEGEFPVSDGPRNVSVSTGGPLTLHADRTVAGNLSLAQGALVTGGRTLTVDSTGSVTRAGGYIDGTLRRYIRTSDTLVAYDLGTVAAGYSPVQLQPFSPSAPGYVSAGVSGQPHPMVSNAAACLRKHWTFASTGIALGGFDLRLSYTPADFNPPGFTEAAHEAAMAAGRYRRGALPGWSGPAVAQRNPGAAADGGAIVLGHAGAFADSFDFTLGRDSFAIWAPFDSGAPAVVSLSPANGDTGVGLTQDVVIGFSKGVTDTSVTFVCSPAVSGWSRSWNAAGTYLTLSHARFAPATEYSFTVTGARDSSGNPLAGVAGAIFTTASPQAVTTLWPGRRYQLMSIPAIPAESTAVGALGPSLGSYGSASWRMFGYSAQQARYVERPAVHNGRGYWLATVDTATLSVSCTPNTNPQTVLAMEPGWNLFGDPYLSALQLGGLEVSRDTGPSYRFDDNSGAVNNTMLRQRVWTYTDNSPDLYNNGVWDTLTPFNESSQIQPWGGYAVYAVGSCYLRFLAAKAQPGVGSPPAADQLWQVRIDVESNAGADRGLVMGVSPQAAAGYDRLDAEKPPLVSDAVSAEIPHPEWGQGPCAAYHYDFRPPAAHLEWPLVVRQSDPEARATIRLEPSGALAAGQRAYLVDRKLGTATEISGPVAVTLTGSREFAVICSDRPIGSLDLRPLAFGLERVSPNPCAGSAVISYQLPRTGRVGLKVYNVAGQLVRTLAEGRQEAGYYAARWDGTDNGRMAAAAGLYFVRLEFDDQARTQKLVRVR